MCIEIRTYYQACGHYRYQNTHHCHIVQRCTPYDVKMTMERTLDLPARPSHIPPGMLDCKMRRATRPVDVMCGDCTRATRGGIGALAAREEGGSGTHANSNANNSTPDPEGDDGLGIPVTPSRMTDQEATPLDPAGSEAFERMRASFMRMSLLSEPLTEQGRDAVD